MDVEDFVGRLQGVRAGGGGYAALCPAHEDNTASLSVRAGDEQGIVLHCHAGCRPDDIVKALNLRWADLGVKQYEVARYPYVDKDGNTLYTAVRMACPKAFFCEPSLPPKGERVLFARPWIDYAKGTGQPIYVVEGEKDALSCQERGIPATTNISGANSWYDHYALELAGLHVIVVADNDEPGRRHAREVATSLRGIAASVTLAKARIGKDISDHLAAGLSIHELDPLEREGELTAYMGEDLAPEETKWAWTNSMALGAITFIDGDPGDGKSVLTCDLAARWSSGMAMPDGSANPFAERVAVVMVSAEDDPRRTISPRLRAAGADMSRICCVTAGFKPTEPFDLSAHLFALEAMVVNLGAKIIIIDPIMAFLGGQTDSNNDASVRRALAPLALMANRRGVAILVVRHLNKGSGKAIYRGGGSIAFVGASRAAYLVSPHPEDDDARVLVPVKNNLARKGPGLVYQLVTDPTYKVARVEWKGRLETSAQELLDGANGEEKPSEITDYLKVLCANGPLSWKDITTHGKAAGYAESTLRSHRSRVLEKAFGHGGNRDVVWQLKVEPLASVTHLRDHLRSRPASENQGSDQAKQGDIEPNCSLAAGTGSDDDLTEDERRDYALRAAPKVCDVCGETGLPYAKPHWVVRCRQHNPMTYRGQGSA